MCVAVCALRLHLAVPGSGVRCGRACWGLGFGCAPPLLGGLLGCVCACVPVPRGLLHLLVGGAVRGCVVGPGLLPRSATPGWGVGACVCLCACPACTPPFLARICCVSVRAGLGFWLCPAPLGWVVGVCVRSCVCPACPRPSSGAACGAAVCGCCRWWCLPPPLPFGFGFFGGGGVVVTCRFLALWCRSLVVPVLGLIVCVPPSLLFRAALFVFFLFLPSQRAVCRRVLGVPSPDGPLLPAWCCRFSLGGPPVHLLGGRVFGAVWVGGSAASCVVGGRFGGCGPFSSPPPCLVFLGGSACSSLCLPWAGARTGRLSVWSSALLLVAAFCQAVPRPHGSGGLCTRWARRPFLPG